MEKDMKVHIIDGVFQPHQLQHWNKTINYSTEYYNLWKEGEGWFEKLEYHVNYALCSQILEKIEKYFNIKEIEGYDYWTHTHTRPARWHYDKDEKAWDKYGITRYPICSSVFYMEADCIGGQLEFNNGISVKPIKNRLVIFSPGLLHGVELETTF